MRVCRVGCKDRIAGRIQSPLQVFSAFGKLLARMFLSRYVSSHHHHATGAAVGAGQGVRVGEIGCLGMKGGLTRELQLIAYHANFLFFDAFPQRFLANCIGDGRQYMRCGASNGFPAGASCHSAPGVIDHEVAQVFSYSADRVRDGVSHQLIGSQDGFAFPARSDVSPDADRTCLSATGIVHGSGIVHAVPQRSVRSADGYLIVAGCAVLARSNLAAHHCQIGVAEQFEDGTA